MAADPSKEKRGYDLGKRLKAMDQTRVAVLKSAREQLEAQGYKQLTMASLAAGSGVTRQTIHNLFGSKQGVLEALFDAMALEGGMERMREVMHQPEPEAMLRAFVQVFCQFWRAHRMLFRRIHGIGAIDPDFGEILEARNQRRLGIAGRIAKLAGRKHDANDIAATLTALTSFEFFDVLVEAGKSEIEAEAAVLELASAALKMKPRP